MTHKTLLHSLSDRSVDEHVSMIAGWAHAATIDARATYIPSVEGVADPVRLRRFNELQHQLSGGLLSLARGQPLGDDYFAMVVDMAKELHATALREVMEKDAEAASRRKRRAG
jgi:hypothetical protein